MTAKQFVKSRYPKARSEKQTQNNGRRYYLIRDNGAYMYIASGDTEGKAWTAAKKSIQSNEPKTD